MAIDPSRISETLIAETPVDHGTKTDRSIYSGGSCQSPWSADVQRSLLQLFRTILSSSCRHGPKLEWNDHIDALRHACFDRSKTLAGGCGVAEHTKD